MKTNTIELKFSWLFEDSPLIKIKKWLVSEGDRVEIDQDIAVVMIQDQEFIFPSPADGFIQSILVKPGEIIDTEQILAVIRQSDFKQ